MRISEATAPAPGWLRELADARSSYQESFGWPVSVQVGARHLVVALGRVLNAVSMPAGLGARVLDRLTGPVPIFASPDGTRWTFLVGPGTPANSTISGDVELAPPGSHVAIPVNPSERWVEPPRRALPPARSVLALVY
ncbi:MAG TPA: hypothetical protein VFV67_17285 [Actinophytocola sp.]|uniref:hypothetical protein n=1 Tax=Actinophytocola sp. TaxID=1872138 RepID=UPI002DBE0808|nr:hypothetical protein [Actinophytocola sp.]HEU5472409.1 hypothetical protein [Actinophytocola sp.]